MNDQRMSERFERFVDEAEGGSIDELVQRFLETEAIAAEYRESALRARIKADLRKHFKRARTADGLPRFFSVREDDPATGQPKRKYKQLDWFDREDFYQAWLQQDRREKQARLVKRGLEDRYGAKFPEQDLASDVAGEQPLLAGME